TADLDRGEPGAKRRADVLAPDAQLVGRVAIVDDRDIAAKRRCWSTTGKRVRQLRGRLAGHAAQIDRPGAGVDFGRELSEARHGLLLGTERIAPRNAAAAGLARNHEVDAIHVRGDVGDEADPVRRSRNVWQRAVGLVMVAEANIDHAGRREPYDRREIG